jgi:hypothetical protein
MIILIGYKGDGVAEAPREEQYSESNSTPTVKKKKRKKKKRSEVSEAVMAEVPQVDSLDMYHLQDSEADVAVTSEPILEPETSETPVDSAQ